MIDYDKPQAALAEEFGVLVTFGASVALVPCIPAQHHRRLRGE